MTMIIAGALVLLCAAGIVAAAELLKEKKAARVICIVLCSAVAFLSAAYIAVSLYFGWAVSNQYANDMPETSFSDAS